MDLGEDLELDLGLPRVAPEISTQLICDLEIPYVVGEFWTNKQRQSSALHEVSYRACFKAQLPEYFISRFSQLGETVYDPFAGRGTTSIQAALMGRHVIQNDINPLSIVLTKPRLHVPELEVIRDRIDSLDLNKEVDAGIDLSMFFHEETLNEISCLREYLLRRKEENLLDDVDLWIAMVATNRLTGHSSGFFSVYTFPPNQAVSTQSQIRINKKRNQKPEYRSVKDIIWKKSRALQKNLSPVQIQNLRFAAKSAQLLSSPSDATHQIKSGSVDLVVTSPPFLDVVQYAEDNWMRCWFNGLDASEIGKRITTPRSLPEWQLSMGRVLAELHRLLRLGGVVAFEVGEVRNQTVRLDEAVIPIALHAGFCVNSVYVNRQSFTKTSNLWGVSNNTKGTNTNRIVVLSKC